MKRYLSWSGGKDSSASIIIAHEQGIHIDGIIFSEVMFDRSRGISGESPEHIKWVYDTAIPIIESFGYHVNVLRAEADYLTLFNTRITKSKIQDRIGKKSGWVIGGMCAANSRLKLSPIRKFYKSVGDLEQIIGIAADELERLKRLKPGSISLLAENNIVEKDTYKICSKYGLLSPLYEAHSRSGCWFCPNHSIKQFAELKREHPELWAELEILARDPDKINENFRYGRTFQSVAREVDSINNQITIFDLLSQDQQEGDERANVGNRQ